MAQLRNLQLIILAIVFMIAGLEFWHWMRLTSRDTVFDQIDLRNPSLSVGGLDGSHSTDVGREQAAIEKARFDTRSRAISAYRVYLWPLAAFVVSMYVRKRLAGRQTHHQQA